MHVRGEWLTVPCQSGASTVRWLGKEALRRYVKNKPDNGGFASVEEVTFYVRCSKGLGLLDQDDALEDVLEDNEFVEVGKQTARYRSENILCKSKGTEFKWSEREKMAGNNISCSPEKPTSGTCLCLNIQYFSHSYFQIS